VTEHSPDTLAKAKTKYIAPIDGEELAARMAEATLGLKRPPGKSATEALDSAPADWGFAFRRGAKAAMDYWRECIEAANRTS
jgi:hypothetical protein